MTNSRTCWCPLMADSELVKVIVRVPGSTTFSERVFPVAQYWDANDCIDHASEYAISLNRLGIATASELVYPDGRNITAHSWRRNG